MGSAKTSFALLPKNSFASGNVTIAGYDIPRVLVFDKDGKTEPNSKNDGSGQVVSLRMITRSVQGAIYFLGEYLRLAEPYSVVGDDPLIRVTSPFEGKGVVSAELDGLRYGVSRENSRSSRSMQVLAIIQ